MLNCSNPGWQMAEIASLWFDVDAPVIAPPTVTRVQVLPLGDLIWENFERLCYRLANRGGDVEDARIYGERGQAQEGIDLYVRRATGDYATWQCKRYQEVTTTDLKKAVTKFLKGDWASRTKLFRLAVAPSLNATGLAEEIETQRARLERLKITFEVFVALSYHCWLESTSSATFLDQRPAMDGCSLLTCRLALSGNFRLSKIRWSDRSSRG